MNVTSELLTSFLSKTTLFQSFDKAQIAEFIPFLQILHLEEGRTIFEEGSSGDAWFLLLDGEVSVTKLMPQGPPHVLAHLEVGESFGEMALIDGAPRMASIHVVMPCIVARLPREVFVNLLREGNQAATKLLWAMSSVLCQRQRELTYVLSDLVDVPDLEPGPEQIALAQLLRAHVTWN